MRFIKNFKQKFDSLSKSKKIQFVAASLLTVILMAGIPVFAWFTRGSRLQTITQVEKPGDIAIEAGRRTGQTEADAIVNFEIKDIDIEKIAPHKDEQTGETVEGTPQMFVFSVKPGTYAWRYNLQIAHTTNIPFTYTLYKANAPDTTGWTESELSTLAIYHPKDDETDITYYQKVGNAIELDVKNEDNGQYGRKIAKKGDTYYNKTYDSGDDPEIYAVPLYLQTKNAIEHPKEMNATEEYDFFILELGWAGTGTDVDGFKDWNKADNNKETDIIYIAAEAAGS